ncbi:MAG: hypothetical protein IE933_13000 [Sphingomonadales bacterium]|nr:hypothetical protein [Sphingomonadales bacterium]MBD3773942.1 hypothetical protein [Paracoccaceae bacterium]
MGDYSVIISHKDGSAPVDFHTPDVAAALVVAGMNLDGGIAELHDGTRKLATLRKCGDGTGAVWIVSS